MLLAPLAIAPAVMIAASEAERRCGPAVAGWLVAAPVTLAIALIALGPASGPVAASAAAHVPAQVAFALAFGMALRRGVFAGFAAGAIAYAAVAVVLPEWLGLIAAVPAVALGARAATSAATSAVPEDPPRGAGPKAPPRGEALHEPAVRAGVAAVFVAVVCSATAVAGPQVAGAIAAFPAMSGSLALLVHRAGGAAATAGGLRGLVHGLGGYFAFAATVALVAPSPAAVPAGLIACAAVGRIAWQAVRGMGGTPAPAPARP